MKVGRRSIALLLACGLLTVVTTEAQTVYKSIGPDGKTVYSDQPPTTGKLQKTMKFELASSALPASAASFMEQFRKTHPGGAPTAPASKGVTLYSAVWCGYCKQAKSWLAGHNVAYTNVDIDAPGGTAALAQASGGGSGAPVLVVDGRTLNGFSAGAYDAAFTGRP